MKIKREKGAIANDKNSKKSSSLKKKIIISYTMIRPQKAYKYYPVIN
jgi:hypothetical protein